MTSPHASAHATAHASADAEQRFRRPRGVLALWVGMLGGPLLALGSLHLLYAVVPHACRAGGDELPLHLVAAAALLLAAVVVWLAWRDWRLAGRAWPGEEAGVVPRSRFMATVGVLLSVFFAVVIVAQWAPVFVFGPCHGA